jgi:hypothetical protein
VTAGRTGAPDAAEEQRMAEWTAPLWRYTLAINDWLNLPARRYGMFVSRVPNPKGFNTVYDFTIWSGRRRIAAWSGTESEAFNAMLHMAEREDRESAMRQLLNGGTAPETGRKHDMEDPAPTHGEIDDATPSTMFERLKLVVERALARQPDAVPTARSMDVEALLHAVLAEMRAPTNEMIQEAIERAGLDEDGGDVLAADVFRRGYEGAIDVVLAGDGRSRG